MPTRLRILIVENSEDDALLCLREIRQAGYEVVFKRVDTESAMQAALEREAWDLILAAYSMPQFGAMEALSVLQKSGLDIPFLIISGTVRVEDAVQAMKAGAHDYLMKADLARLASAIERELGEVKARQARREAEASLRFNEERLRQILFSVGDIIYVTEIFGGRIYFNTYISPNAETITGYPVERFLADPDFWYSTVVHPDDRRLALAFRRDLPEDRKGEMEYRLTCANNKTIWIRNSARLVTQNGGPHYIYGVLSDVTERRYLEDQLRHSQKMEAVGLLAGGIVHDFNNILMIIVGYSDLLLSRHMDADDPRRDDLEEIKRAGERASALTRQLLVFSQKQMYQPRLLSLNFILAGVEKMLRRLINETIDLVTLTAPDLREIMVDHGQMEQLIVNLVINARDAMPQGGQLTIQTANVTLTGAYVARTVGVTAGDYVMLLVKDTGVGIDQATQARMFEPFFTTKKVGKGTGLGLSTVYAIVQQSHGHIEVESEPGQGATFRIYLPVADKQADEPAVAAKTAPAPEYKLGSETVLVVEDETDVREVICQVLQRSGYTVLGAANGVEALKISCNGSRQVDLIITDLIMPDINGSDLARRLLKVWPQASILFMSGYSDETIVEQGIANVGSVSLHKPFNANTLIHAVRDVFERKKSV